MYQPTYRGAIVRKNASGLVLLNEEVEHCFRCPRLVEWRERVATSERRASFRDETYWGKPVPGFGDRNAQIVIVGLAPAAHGGNRTGRMFTGDRSGDWLYGALHKAGFANQATSVARNDGLTLRNVYITASVKCAPPANKPTIEERDTCVDSYLVREFALLSHRRVEICLGKFAYDIVSSLLSVAKRPAFGHGVELAAPDGTHIICSFHPSQQNTFTKKLTKPMFDRIFERANLLISDH
jgi:uracil-DNA glycosylase